MGLLYLQDADTSTVAWIFLNLVPGLGTGILFSSMSIAIPASSPVKDMAFAVAFMSFFRTFGQGVGVAIGGTIFQNQLNKKLSAIPLFESLAKQYSRDAAGLVQAIKSMPHGDERSQLVDVYADSLKVVWAVMCGLAGAGLISSLFVEEYSLAVKLDTEQGFRYKAKTPEPEDARQMVEEKKDEAGA